MLLSFTSSFSITWNTILSVLYLKEEWVKEHIKAIGVVIIGSGSFLLVAHNEEREFAEGELLSLYLKPLTLAFIAGCICYIIFSYMFSK